MSTEGTGVVAVGAAVGFGGPAILAAGAVAGLGALIVNGVIWCGKKMEENIERARQEAIRLQQAAYAESRANVQDISFYVAGQAERIALSTANLSLSPSSSAPTQLQVQKQLDDALARMRTSLTRAGESVQIQAETRQDTLLYRLKSEIEASRGLLPSGTIARAEQALQGSEKEMHAALNALQAAWQNIVDAQVTNTRQERQTRQLLRSTNAQLFAIDSLLRNAGTTHDSPYTQQKQGLERRIEHAQALIATDLQQATTLAEETRRATQELMSIVSFETLGEWDRVHREIVLLQGTLEALARTLQEAVAVKLLSDARIQDVKQRLVDTQREATQLGQSATVPSQDRLAILYNKVTRLKTEVLRQVKTGQQQQIAETVATTLGELGFRADSGAPPLVEENGSTLRIVATRTGNTPGFSRDDKVVSFDVSREGNLSYDFSGYVGDTCVSEAKEVFAALKAKGLYVLDTEALEKLRKVPDEQITDQNLQRMRYEPQPEQNKVQAQLAERLQKVLAEMQFYIVQQSVIGGCIDIEAFNGNTGYHIVLPAEGSAEVFRDHIDISNDQEDVLVHELTRPPEHTQIQVESSSKSLSRETWQEDRDALRQQGIDY